MTDKPPSIIKPTMDTLENIRGYQSTIYGAEAKAIKELQALGYTANEIVQCYVDEQKKPFWADKPLHLMSVKKVIGHWKAQQKPVVEKNKYLAQNLPVRAAR